MAARALTAGAAATVAAAAAFVANFWQYFSLWLPTNGTACCARLSINVPIPVSFSCTYLCFDSILSQALSI